MATEDVLDRREGSHGRRHSTDFWFLVFGDPDSAAFGRGGWRATTCCVHVTIVDDDQCAGRADISGLQPGSHPVPGSGSFGAARRSRSSWPGQSMATSGSVPRARQAVVAPKAPDDIYTSTQVDAGSLRLLADLQPGMAVARHGCCRSTRGATSSWTLYAGRLEEALALGPAWTELRAEHFPVRLGGKPRAWPGALLPAAECGIRDRARERGEQRQPRPQRDARRGRATSIAADLLQAHKRHPHSTAARGGRGRGGRPRGRRRPPGSPGCRRR